MSTIDAILNQFIAPAEAFVESYARISRTFKKYESLNYTATTKTQQSLLQERVKSVFEHAAPLNNVAILGEFGTGKTAFAYNFLYYALIDWLQGKSEVLPLIFRFRNYRNAPSFYDWFSEEILTISGIDLDKRTIIKLIQSKRLLIILDGLDELPRSNDRQFINTVLSALNKLATMRSPLMLTCRTNFFPAVFEEASALQKFERLYIRELEPQQIRRIVERNFQAKPGDALLFMDNLENNSSIAELARRPLFLSMLTELFQSDERLNIKNPAELYHKLTSTWLAAESLRGDSTLDASDRRTILQELAFHQFLKREFSSGYADLKKELPAIIRPITAIPKQTPIATILKEISNFSFLDRREKDQFSFAHKSFQEYFIAEKLAGELIQEQYENFGKRALQEEIFEFLSLLLENQDKFDYLEKGLLNTSVYFVARGNLIPVMRKAVKKSFIPSLLEIFLNDGSPLLRFMCGYTLPTFQAQFPAFFDTPQIIERLNEAYRSESNSLVRLRIAWLLNQGRYERFEEFPELAPNYDFDFDSIQMLLVPGIKEAYETIIKVDRESEYVLEESIRALTLIVIHTAPKDLDNLEEMIRRFGLIHKRERVKDISEWAIQRIKGVKHKEISIGESTHSTLGEMQGLAQSDSAEAPEEVDQETREWIELLRETVEASIDDINFGVAQLADMMASSERNLHRKVREMLGMTPNQFIQETRLNLAKRMLEKKTYGTVKQVCLAIGFKKPDYFTKLFEKKFGRRPSSYL